MYIYCSIFIRMKKTFLWISLLIATYLITQISKSNPDWIDHFYIPYIYQPLNRGLFFIFDRFSFSVGDILYALVVIFLLQKIIRIIKAKKSVLPRLIQLSIKFVAIFYFWFNLSWGLCNYQTPLANKMNIKTTYEQAELETETQRLINQTNDLQHSINKENNTTQFDKNSTAFSQAARKGYQKIGQQIDKNTAYISDVKASFYSMALSKMGIGGYFNPFTHENQVNSEVPHLTHCMTTAHEIAHQLGFASESEANFLGYLALINQENKVYQYAANLYALRYCLREVFRTAPEKAEKFYQQLNTSTQQDIQSIDEFWQNNKNISADWTKVFYGNFLKINNQKEGMRSYHLFVNLLIGYHQNNNDN